LESLCWHARFLDNQRSSDQPVILCVHLELSLFIDQVLNKKVPWMVHPLKRLLTQTLFQILGVLFFIICLGFIYFIFGSAAVDARSPRIVDLRQGLYALISAILWALMISVINTGDFLLRNWKTATLKAAEFEIKAAPK